MPLKIYNRIIIPSKGRATSQEMRSSIHISRDYGHNEASIQKLINSNSVAQRPLINGVLRIRRYSALVPILHPAVTLRHRGSDTSRSDTHGRHQLSTVPGFSPKLTNDNSIERRTSESRGGRSTIGRLQRERRASRARHIPFERTRQARGIARSRRSRKTKSSPRFRSVRLRLFAERVIM